MRGKLKLAAVSALAAAAVILSACKADDIAGGSQGSPGGASRASSKNAVAKPAPSVVAPAPAEEARRVTVEEVKKMLDAGKAVIYDTRAKSAYDAEHIKGSLSVPYDQVAARTDDFPKDKTLIFYCT